MYGHHLLYSRIIWINRVRLPNLLVVSSTTGKLGVLADASVVSTHIRYMYWYSTAVCTRYLFTYQVLVYF